MRNTIVRILEGVIAFTEDFMPISIGIGTIIVFYIMTFKLHIQLSHHITVAVSALISAVILLIVGLIATFILESLEKF